MTKLPNEVKIYRLDTFDIIMGEVVDKNDDVVYLQYPLEIVSEYNFDNDVHELLLLQFQPYTDDIGFPLPVKKILSCNDPTSKVLTYYYKRVLDTYKIESGDPCDDIERIFMDMDDETRH